MLGKAVTKEAARRAARPPRRRSRARNSRRTRPARGAGRARSETREELLRRLTDPTLTLEEASPAFWKSARPRSGATPTGASCPTSGRRATSGASSCPASWSSSEAQQRNEDAGGLDSKESTRRRVRPAMRVGIFTESYPPLINGVSTSVQTLIACIWKQAGHDGLFVFTSRYAALPGRAARRFPVPLRQFPGGAGLRAAHHLLAAHPGAPSRP